MRTNKELLKILLANIDKLNCCGLCLLVHNLYKDVFTIREVIKLKNYIKENKPKKTSRLYNRTQEIAWYYWPSGDKEPRIRWLKYHIRICKD